MNAEDPSCPVCRCYRRWPDLSAFAHVQCSMTWATSSTSSTLLYFVRTKCWKGQYYATNCQVDAYNEAYGMRTRLRESYMQQILWRSKHCWFTSLQHIDFVVKQTPLATITCIINQINRFISYYQLLIDHGLWKMHEWLLPEWVIGWSPRK